MTANDLIDKLGGTTAVARIVGVRTSAVSNWRRFGCFPPRVYFQIEAACERGDFKAPRELFRELSDAERAA